MRQAVTNDFKILGELNDDWETFQANIEYNVFFG